MQKTLRVFCLIFIMGLLSFSLIGCSDSEKLTNEQYQIFQQGNSFTIKVTDTDINAEDIESVKVKIRYKYTIVEYDNGSIYASDIDSKTKTETFVVEKFGNICGTSLALHNSKEYM